MKYIGRDGLIKMEGSSAVIFKDSGVHFGRIHKEGNKIYIGLEPLQEGQKIGIHRKDDSKAPVKYIVRLEDDLNAQEAAKVSDANGS